ncbi:MAG: type II/IV secretion system ATPase subunit [Candidatus Aenigmarchaeota archaeon]|nr:type II/IV secretion system ATPase subunit [Candidatus Aenigmarchaeota archaeon]
MEDKKVKKLLREAAKKVQYEPKPRPTPEGKRLFSLLAKAASRLGEVKQVEQKTEPSGQPVPEATEIDIEDVSKFYEPEKKGSLPAVFKRVGKILSGEKPGFETEEYKKIEENEAVLIPSVNLKRAMAEKLNDSDIMKTNIVYSLVPRNPSKDDLIFSYANIKWSREKGKPMYSVAEPVLTPEERKLLEELKDNIRERLDVDFTRLKGQQAVGYLNGKIEDALRLMERKLDQRKKRAIQYYLHRDFVGMGKIDPFMNDPNIEDISCDGVGIPIFVAHRNPIFGYLETNIMFNDKEELDSFVVKLAQRCGKSVSMANPIVDGALPDGSRLQATMVSGGTATGKTSILNSIAMFLKHELKVVSIEDTPEVRIAHPNWIQEVAREAISSGEGNKVDMFALLKESLRQRPDYIIVGEVRGREAFVLFQQIATGHPGLSTIHAEDINSLMDRLTTEPISLPPNLIESLDAVVFLGKIKYRGAYVRRANQVLEIRGFDRDKHVPVINEVFKWDLTTDTYPAVNRSYILGKIRYERSMTEEEMQQEIKDRADVLEWMRTNSIKDYTQFADLINRYYVDKESVMRRVRRVASSPKDGGSIKRKEILDRMKRERK